MLLVSSVVIGLFLSVFPEQQDVSEFTHKLLDWLEDAFQMKAEEDRYGKTPR